MSTSPDTIETACSVVADDCMSRYCAAMSFDAPTVWTETVDGVTVTAEVEGDPDGNYVSFTATVDGVEVATGSVFGSTMNFHLAA